MGYLERSILYERLRLERMREERKVLEIRWRLYGPRKRGVDQQELPLPSVEEKLEVTPPEELASLVEKHTLTAQQMEAVRQISACLLVEIHPTVRQSLRRKGLIDDQDALTEEGTVVARAIHAV